MLSSEGSGGSAASPAVAERAAGALDTVLTVRAEGSEGGRKTKGEGGRRVAVGVVCRAGDG